MPPIHHIFVPNSKNKQLTVWQVVPLNKNAEEKQTNQNFSASKRA